VDGVCIRPGRGVRSDDTPHRNAGDLTVAIQKTPAPPSRSSLLRRIRALETRLEQLGDADVGRPPERPASEPAPADPATEVQELVACGRPLAAVRRYRELTGCDEAEAHRAVDVIGGGAVGDA
jgi:hypothetical protein